MTKISWFFLRLALGAGLFVGVAAVPVRADVSAYLESRHPISVPAGAKSLCTTYTWACASVSKSTAFDQSDMRMVGRINSKINRRVRQIEDIRQYRKSEVWALPTRRGGDCEDIVLLKKRELLKAGVPANRLLIATALDTRMRGHAVLVMRSNDGDLILDSLTSRIKSWDKTGYLFLKMQNPDKPTTWDAILAGGPLLKHADKS